MALSTTSQFEVMRHSRLRRTIGLPRRAGATTCLPTFYYLLLRLPSLSRPLGQSGSRLCFVPSFFHPSLGFIRSTSILRRVAHTNVSLILLHSILYSFYSASSSSSSSSVSSSSLLFPVLCNFIESPYLPRFVSDRG